MGNLLLRANGGDFVSVDVDLIEVAAGRMNDYAANSAVAHEQVRTAANHKEWKIVAPAKPDQFAQRRFVAWFYPKLRRTANAQRGVF